MYFVPDTIDVGPDVIATAKGGGALPLTVTANSCAGLLRPPGSVAVTVTVTGIVFARFAVSVSVLPEMLTPTVSSLDEEGS